MSTFFKLITIEKIPYILIFIMWMIGFGFVLFAEWKIAIMFWALPIGWGAGSALAKILK